MTPFAGEISSRWASLLRLHRIPTSLLYRYNHPHHHRLFSSSSSPSSSPPLASHLTASPSSIPPPPKPNTHPVLHLLRLNVPIHTQLRLEEALLRTSPHSYLIINHPPPTAPPTIVLGISGRPELWLNLQPVIADSILTLKRFTGGGTVYCDHSTYFTTFILARSSVPSLLPYPQPLLTYIFHLYSTLFPPSSSLTLHSNDFCLSLHKFAGNAQAITSTHLLHHTSILHSFSPTAMQRYLAMPPEGRRPGYRGGRGHGEFVVGLGGWMEKEWGREVGVEEGVGWVGEGLVRGVKGLGWEVREVGWGDVEGYMEKKHDRVLKVIDWKEELERIERETKQKANKERAQLNTT